MQQIFQNRDHSVDFLKGFAIFLMVMGHFLANSIDHIDSADVINGWRVGQWIYSFHMPLFFFLSGYLSVKAADSWKDLGHKILRKAQTLLLPGLMFMCIGYLCHSKWEMAWFLKVLFQISVIFACIRFVADRRQWSLLTELLIHGCIFVIWFVGSYYLKDSWANTHLWLHGAAARYPYIVFGYLFARLGWKNALQKKNGLVSLALLGHLVTYYVGYYILSGTIASYFQSYIVAPAAIIVCMAIVDYIPLQGRGGGIICYLGYQSLAIYLLSDYFLPEFPALGDWWNVQTAVTSIVSQIVLGVGVSAICVSLCLLVEWVISKSTALHFLCFGRK